MKHRKQGFTLAELLIVVAIIAVLVAISIPIFSGQVKKARLATNQANARAAYSAAEAALLFEPDLPAFQNNGAYCSFVYDVSTGKAELIVKNGTSEAAKKWASGTGIECWVNYRDSYKAIPDWTVDYTGNGQAGSGAALALGDKVYTRWKIDIYRGDSSHQAGEIYAIYWKE